MIAAALVALFFVAPIAGNAVMHDQSAVPWHQASLAASGLAPDNEPRAVIQAYAAPAFKWRGIFAVHTWIAYKGEGVDAPWHRWDVMGFGEGRTIRHNRAAPDGQWFGAEPALLLDRRGPEAARLIPRIEAAIAEYPYAETYVTYPGPNSNTFTAHIGREVPELGLDLPANAIGKDFRPLNQAFGHAPSGAGLQFSLFGLAGVIVAPEEGFEINLLGLSAGVDASPPSLRLPALGRLPLPKTDARAAEPPLVR